MFIENKNYKEGWSNLFDIETKSNEIILQAHKVCASDVHIVPTSCYSIIEYRIDNQLLTIEEIRNNEAEKIISHLKFRSKMDIGERRKPQSGSLKMKIKKDKLNIRLSTLPTTPHESLSIRLLPQNEVETLHRLTLFPKHTAQLSSLIKKAHGLVIVSGPTGSGKTTTIYSLLNEAAARKKRIVCIEDPIEKRTDKFIQVEINEKAGLTYAHTLKAVLRHDPDIIMIGEIRDVETATVAIRAAMTGHLVISTIHAKNCLGSIARLKELGIKEHDINETVIGLVSQRLLEMKCSICGNTCSKYCRTYRKRRRLAVFEILADQSLQRLLTKCKTNIGYGSLEQAIKKSFALGYVNEEEYERWLC